MVNVPQDLQRCQSLHLWDELDETRQDGVAQALLAAVAGVRSWRLRWEYAGLRACSLGRQSHRLPRFSYGGQPFTLVPGAVAQLGWSGEQLAVRPDQRRNWEMRLILNGESLAEGGFETVARPRLEPRHHALIHPFLSHVEGEFVSEWGGDADVDADVLPALRRAVAAEGFRLPTVDEWEWAARGGEVGVFRWGDTWPDATPNSSSCPFDLHRLPNGFGLTLPHDGFGVECVADPALFVGGDGGVLLQSDRPPLETWLPLASAHRFPAAAAEDALRSYLDLARFRRILPLAPLLAAGPSTSPSTPFSGWNG
jgi:hypothetical protein